MGDGDIKRLEELTHFSSFPHGKDGWLGRHWLTHAVDCGNLAAIEWVLSKKPAINYQDDEGECALTSALQFEANAALWDDEDARLSAGDAVKRVIEIVNLLVREGADINQRLTLDKTPLHAAAHWSSPEVVRHLLALGADPNLRDCDYGFDAPADCAKSSKRPEVETILREAMQASSTGQKST